MLAVAGNAWLKRVFSRPGPQEPKRGLPGQSGENPNLPLEKERPRAREHPEEFRFFAKKLTNG